MTDLEQLKYPIGKFQASNPVDRAALDQAITDLASLPEKLSAAVGQLSKAQLDTPYRPGGLTIRQLAHHVVDSHTNAYVRLKIALTENEPTIKAYEEAKWAELADTANTPVSVSLDMLSLLHKR